MQKLGCSGWLLLALVCLVTGQDELEVKTTSGTLRGTCFTLLSKTEQGYGFYGVPFAAPPINELRFAPPKPIEPWTGIRNATQYGPACPQNVSANLFGDVMDFSKATGRVEVTSSEDCLNLNIYTPALTGARPVMVWIHGGGFSVGWAAQYDGRSLALLQDVVMVTIQYRLGFLGFMSTEDGAVKGNMGLMDQVLALQWIQDNIANFGGDPDKVTIFGESAGGSSVSFHLISPKSRGLFRRAILQSGTLASSDVSAAIDVPKASRNKASVLGCSQANTVEMLQCLRDLNDPDVFWKSAGRVLSLPSIDGDYLPDDPAKLMLNGQYNKEIDVLLGTTQVEGYFLVGLDGRALFANPTVQAFEAFVKSTLPECSPYKAQYAANMSQAVLQEYAQNIAGDEIGLALAEFMGDLILTKDIIFTLHALAANGEGNLYFYEFRQRPSLSQKPSYIMTDHGDDLFFCFGESHFEIYSGYYGMARTTEDRKMENLTVAYWTHFAKTGNPNSQSLPKWPSYRDDDSYIILQVDPQVSRQFRPHRTKFWMETFPVASGDEPIMFPEPLAPSTGYSFTEHLAVPLIFGLLHMMIIA